MKNYSAPLQEDARKIKNKRMIKSINNFSEKYFQFTKEKCFLSTPKKSNHDTRDVTSPRDTKEWKK